MGISEKKMQIVINNYFKQECSVNTSIREAFEKGFRIGIKKASSVVPVVRCRDCKFRENDDFCTGRGFPYQLVPDDGFCDKGERRE